MKCKKKIESQINIPNTVKIEKKEHLLVFRGILGLTVLDLTKIDPTGLGSIKFSLDGKTLYIFSQSKYFFYSFHSLLKNKIRGVTVGFLTYLRIVGVGYRASLIPCLKNNSLLQQSLSIPSLTRKKEKDRLSLERDIRSKERGDVLNFKLGYSHNLKYQVPHSIRAFLLLPTLLCLFGVDKNQVSQIGSKIKSFKGTERYKGKGIRLTTDKVTLSQGKRK